MTNMFRVVNYRDPVGLCFFTKVTNKAQCPTAGLQIAHGIKYDIRPAGQPNFRTGMRSSEQYFFRRNALVCHERQERRIAIEFQIDPARSPCDDFGEIIVRYPAGDEKFDLVHKALVITGGKRRRTYIRRLTGGLKIIPVPTADHQSRRWRPPWKVFETTVAIVSTRWNFVQLALVLTQVISPHRGMGKRCTSASSHRLKGSVRVLPEMSGYNRSPG